MPDNTCQRDDLKPIFEKVIGVKINLADYGIAEEVEAYIQNALTAERQRMEAEQLRFMAMVLKEVGGKITISRKNLVSIDDDFEISTWTEPDTGGKTYRLADNGKIIRGESNE